MEGFRKRLERCEDLYEGADDRISDYRWYMECAWMELTIILMLIEIVLMALDIDVKRANRRGYVDRLIG